MVVVVAVPSDVSVQTLVVVGCVCGAVVVLLCIILAVVCCFRCRRMKSTIYEPSSSYVLLLRGPPDRKQLRMRIVRVLYSDPLCNSRIEGRKMKIVVIHLVLHT